MKKQKLLQKGKQVFAAILSASMLMTSVIPETMVSAAEEYISSSEEAGDDANTAVKTLTEETAGNVDVSGEEEQEGLENDVEDDLTEETTETEDATEEEQAVGDAEESEDAEVSEEAVRTDLVNELNARIVALPSVEEFQKMNEEDQNAVLEEVNAIADKYYDELTGEEQALVETEKMDAILEWLSGQVTTLSDDVTSIDNGIMKCWRSAYDSLTWDVAGADANTTDAYMDYWGYQVRKSEELENAEITVEPAFKYGGKFVELTYKVTANKAINGGKLSVGAILCTNTDRYHTECGVKRKGIKEQDSDEKYSGFLVTSENGEQCAQIYFRGKGLSSGDKVATAWMGDYSDGTNYYINFCNKGYNQDGMGERNYVVDKMDYVKETAMILTWNVNLKKGETGEYQLLIGAGYSKNLDAALEGIKVNYSSEALTGFFTGKYEIVAGEKTYYFTIAKDGTSIPLQGTDSNNESYNFIGQSLTIKNIDDNQEVIETNELSVPERQTTPTETAVTGFKFSEKNKTITISANRSQEYILVPSSKVAEDITSEMWANAKSLQWGSEITFDEDALGKALQIGTEYVVYTRIPSSETNFASEVVRLNPTLKMHAHKWTYSVENNEIKAVCTVDKCQYETEPLKVYFGEIKDDGTNSFEYTGHQRLPYIVDEIGQETGNYCTQIFYQTEDEGVTSGGTKLEGSTLEEKGPVNVGNYYVEVSAPGTTDCIKKAFKITPKSLASKYGYDDSYEYEIVVENSEYSFDNNLKTPTIKVKRQYSYDDNYLTENTDYILSGTTSATACGTYTITVEGTGNYTGTREVTWRIVDHNPPTGEISIGNNKWTKGDSTAASFFKDEQTVTITAHENEGESGVAAIYYSISDSFQSDPENMTWQQLTGGNITIEPNRKVYIYAKIVDYDGNITYLNTNKIVVYTDPVQETQAIRYIRTTKDDVKAIVNVSGNTISEIKEGETGIDPSCYTVNDGGTEIAFKASYLSTLTLGSHTYTLFYRPMGEGEAIECAAKISLTVERADASLAGTKITNLKQLSRTYNGKDIAATPDSAHSDKMAVTVEYKRKEATDNEYSSTVPVDAGTYTVRVTYPEDENYKRAVITGDFTISPKKIEGEDVKVFIDNKDYDGKTDATVTATVNTGMKGQELEVTGLTGTFTDKNAGTNKEVTIDDLKVKITGKNGATNPSNYQIIFPTTGTATINKKAITATVTATDKDGTTADKVYDGDTSINVKATVNTEVTGEELEITGLTGTFDDKNVGNNKTVSIDLNGKKVTASKDASSGTNPDNYEITYPSTCTASILPRLVQLKWTEADLTYTGRPQTVTVDVDNKVKGDEFNFTYAAADGKTNTATAAGSYTAKVTGLGNANYTLEGATGAELPWSISYMTVADKDLPTPSGTKADGNEWYTGDITLTPGSGYLISKDGENWSDTLIIEEEGDNRISYYLKTKDEHGYITDKKEINIKKDATEPTAQMTAGDMAAGSGKLFFKDTAEIKITGSDGEKGSGIAKIEYQKVASGKTISEDATWTDITDKKTVTMNANDKGVIYARITDTAGNVTIIHSGDIVVYSEVTGSNEASYTRTTGEDMTTDISLNGNTVKTIKYGETVLTEGTDYTVNDEGRIVISSKYLETLPAGEHDLTVSWNPLGEEFTEGAEGAAMADSTIKVSVNRVDPASAETRITNADKLSKTFDGQPSAKVTVTSKSTSAPKVEYKLKGAADSTYTTQEPGNAGTYVVRVTYPQNGDYEASVVTAEFTIAQKEIGIQWGTTSFTYNGMAQAPTAAATGLVGADQCMITVEGAQKAVGIYTATAVSLSNPNYCLPQNGTTISFEIKAVSDKTATGLALNAGLKVTQTGSSIGVKWGKVKGADGYNIYVQYCGSSFTAKSLNQVKSGSKTSLTVKKVNGKKLNLKKNYKVYVEAYKNVNGEKVVMGRSVTAHIVGRKNSKFTNVNGIKLQKNTFTLKTGKTATIYGTTVKVNRYRKQLSDAHAKELRYATSNPSVATVTAKGKIKAVGKGTCTVYVYARNGYTKKVKVTVK